MPTRRANGRYYVQRTFQGVGKVYKSLHTDRKGLARRREEALAALHRQGMGQLVRAFNSGRLSIQEIHEAYESGRASQLLQDFRQGDAPLAKACEAALANKQPDVKESTLTRYETGLRHFRRFCGDEASTRDSLTTDRIQEFKAFRLEEDAAKETVMRIPTETGRLFRRKPAGDSD